MKKFFAHWLPLLLYLILIFVLSSFALRNTPLTTGYGSYMLHAAEYFVLALLALRAFRTFRHPFLYAILFAAMFGVLDEFHQLLVPDRTFSFLDMLADLIGSCVVLAFRHKKMHSLLGLD